MSTSDVEMHTTVNGESVTANVWFDNVWNVEVTRDGVSTVVSADAGTQEEAVASAFQMMTHPGGVEA